MFETTLLFIIFFTFLLAGFVKGVIGLGLPTVSLALLTVATDLPSAMALLLVPSFVTNVWQAMVGGNTRVILLRLWPFLLMATVTVWLGAIALSHLELPLLSALLGVLLVTYAVIALSGFRITVVTKNEKWVGPLLGAMNGVLTGMTGSFVVPGVMFLQAIGLSRDMLIQAMGMLFTVSTLALAIALQSNHLLTSQHGIASAGAMLPAIAGMILGQRVRKKLPEPLFRKVFFVSLLILGIYIMVSSFAWR
jgi:uncharacterized membrane protein YfcA